jgi:hypothetical protein
MPDIVPGKATFRCRPRSRGCCRMGVSGNGLNPEAYIASVLNCVQPGLVDTAQIRRLYPGDARREFAKREIPCGISAS